jgi:putative transposase
MGIIFSGTLWSMADQGDEAVRKGAYCAWQIHHPFVFPVKYRKGLLNEAVTTIIQETAAEIAERFPIELESIGTDKNHIHLLCNAYPIMDPGRIVQMFKSITAREIFRRKPAVKQVLWGDEFWTDGYYAATVGERANLQTLQCIEESINFFFGSELSMTAYYLLYLTGLAEEGYSCSLWEDLGLSRT